MPEGVRGDDGIGGGVHDDPDAAPPPGPDAPRGWTWNRPGRKWMPRQRGPVLWQPGAAASQGGGQPQDNAGQAGSSRDPDPAWQRVDQDQGGSGSGGGGWDPSEVGDDVKGEIEGMLALFYSVPADFLITADPYCFGALNENLDATIKATVPIICRSQLAVQYVTSAAGLILWIKLMATLKPFIVAVWQHHVIHSVELADETDGDGEATGRIVAVHQDYSVYPAA